MISAKVLNIQKFSVHDGDGIRTTVFFKGCPLKCSWCHNPESKGYLKEIMYNSERCVACGKCVLKCPVNAASLEGTKLVIDRQTCDCCGICTDYCTKEALEIAGKDYSVKELVKQLDKDRMFYEVSDGGITLSGGEAMSVAPEYLENLVKSLEKKGYDIAVDTCGYTSFDRFEKIMPYVRTFLYDIKHIDSAMHEKYTGVGNEQILSNLESLSAAGAKIYIRLPLIEGVNASDDDIYRIVSFLKDKNINVSKVNLLPYHDFGSDKLERLNLPAEKGFSAPSKERLEYLKNIFVRAGFNDVKVGG